MPLYGIEWWALKEQDPKNKQPKNKCSWNKNWYEWARIH